MTHELAAEIDAFWSLLATFIVFVMQLGFSMLETGVVRARSAVNILTKNFIDISMSTLMWWAIGSSLAFGRNLSHYQIDDAPDATRVTRFLFNLVFCSTTTTIVSGAIAERVRMTGYIIFVVVMSGFIYPMVVRWTWGGGWLMAMTPAFQDFAGSGVVHMTGGFAGLTGAIIIGPRIGRFEKQEAFSKDEFKPHSVPLYGLGTLLLWFGFFGFNCGSTGGISSAVLVQQASKIAVNTTLAASSGGVLGFVCSMIRGCRRGSEAFAKRDKIPKSQKAHRMLCLHFYDVPDLLDICNGILGGLVSITCPCAYVSTLSACVIGCIGGVCAYLGTKVEKYFQVDDPVSVWPVHGLCGLWGLLSCGLLDQSAGFLVHGTTSLLRSQVLGSLAILAWTLVTNALVFSLLYFIGILRVGLAFELRTENESRLAAYRRHNTMNWVPNSSRYTTFLSHHWDPVGDTSSCIGGESHRRCRLIYMKLAELGHEPWMDTEGGCTENIMSDICAGIERSDTFTILVTTQYCDRVRAGANNYCGAEFQYACQRLGVDRMVCVVLDEDMRDTARWCGPVGLRLGGTLYVDFSAVNWSASDEEILQDTSFNAAVEMLRDRTSVTMTPCPSGRSPSPVDVETGDLPLQEQCRSLRADLDDLTRLVHKSGRSQFRRAATTTGAALFAR